MHSGDKKEESNKRKHETSFPTKTDASNPTEPPAKRAHTDNTREENRTTPPTASMSAAAAAPSADDKVNDEKRTLSKPKVSTDEDSDGDYDMSGGGGGGGNDDNSGSDDSDSDEDDNDRDANSDTDSDKDHPSNKEGDTDSAEAMETDEAATNSYIKIVGENANFLQAHLTQEDIRNLESHKTNYDSLGQFVSSTDGQACCALLGTTSKEFIDVINSHIKQERELPQDLHFNIINCYLASAPGRCRKLIEVKGEKEKVNTFIEWINKHRKSFRKRKDRGDTYGTGFEDLSSRIARSKNCELKESDAIAKDFFDKKLDPSYERHQIKISQSRTDLAEIRELFKIARFELEESTGVLYCKISMAIEAPKNQDAYFGQLRKALKSSPLFKDKNIDFSRPARFNTIKDDKHKHNLIAYMVEHGTQFPLKKSVAKEVNEIIRKNAPKWKAKASSKATGKHQGTACDYLKAELKKRNVPNPEDAANSIIEKLLKASHDGQQRTMDKVLPFTELGNCFCVLVGCNSKRRAKSFKAMLDNIKTPYKEYFTFDEANVKIFQKADGRDAHLAFFKLTEAGIANKKITLAKITKEFEKNKIKWKQPVRNSPSKKSKTDKNKKPSSDTSSASASAAPASGESKAASPDDKASSKAAAEKEQLQSQVRTAADKMAKQLAKTKSEDLREYKSVPVETEPNKYTMIKDPALLKIYNKILKDTHTTERNKLIGEAKEAGFNAGKKDASSAGAPSETPNALDPKFADPKKTYGKGIFEEFYYPKYSESYRASKPAASSFSVASLLGQFGHFSAPNSAQAAAQPAPQPPVQQPQAEQAKDNGPKKMDLS